MKYILSLALAWAVVFQPVPALATYCGPAADAATIEKLTVQWLNSGRPPHPLDRTYIMAIVVTGNYAEADFQLKGQASLYFQRDGVWRQVGFFPPKSWPPDVGAKLAMLMDQRSEGSKQCTNPNFVNHPTGP